ncbi:DNA-binding protein [Caballeronia sp. SEWSISQ10-4 2]|uniref:DNA-binding protein n=1 Tax=Caballeronia sp. SEWSISQ10-4 2 TaxID=2937438 RepID=UPI00265325CB|nr:DNA-binding protein [Caballeronia sp. SEWSISQ10-4 2]MDN7184285.1 DNA-binding protein [Caballeronia sp. SEWSISQ10-4 2]
MDDSPALEAQLQAEIEQLRIQFPRTQELYREVCVLLFFRHGITPTANRLYQLVKKGSMNAPAEALARFWATLRDKSRVRIEHPDLPAELQSATGELAAALWMRAVDTAQGELATAQLEAQRSVADAQAWQTRAEAERDQVRQELTGSAAALDAAQTRITELDQALAISVAAASALQDQLGLAHQGEHQLQRALETARHDFASELDKLRADGTLAQERLKAAENRALLEIDRERQAAARLQKELDTANRKTEQGSARHRDDVQKLQAQVGNLRQQVGVLEGKLDALRTENARYVDEAVQARGQRDQLALSLTQAAAKQKVSTAKRTAKSTTAPRKSSEPVGKSPRTKKL